MTNLCINILHQNAGTPTPATHQVAVLVWPLDVEQMLRAPAMAKIGRLPNRLICADCQRRLASAAADDATIEMRRQFAASPHELRQIFENDDALDYGHPRLCFLSPPPEPEPPAPQPAT